MQTCLKPHIMANRGAQGAGFALIPWNRGQVKPLPEVNGWIREVNKGDFQMDPGTVFTKISRYLDAAMWVYVCLIALKFDKCIGSSAAKALVKVHSSTTISTPNLVALSMHIIWWLGVLSISESRPWTTGNLAVIQYARVKSLCSQVSIVHFMTTVRSGST